MLAKEIIMPRCTSCNRLLNPSEDGSARFLCPSCGDVIIIRCKQCRLFGNKYICPKCGFEGP